MQSDKKAPKADFDDEIIDDDDGGTGEEGGADFDLESEELKERYVARSARVDEL